MIYANIDAMSLGFTALRAYALTRRRWLSGFVFLLSIVPVVMNMVRYPFIPVHTRSQTVLQGSLIWLHVYGVHPAAWGCISGLVVLPSTPVGEMYAIRRSIFVAPILMAS